MDVYGTSYNFIPRKLLPWAEMNEYEGVVEGELEEVGSIIAYTQLSKGDEWQELQSRIGEVVPVVAIFKREHPNQLPKLLPQDATPSLKPNKDLGYERPEGYELVCRVTAVEPAEMRGDHNDIIQIDQPFSMQVDLEYPDSTSKSELSQIKAGDKLHLIGVFVLDFDPE